MDKLRFEFKLRGAADGKSNVMCITSIGTQDERLFGLPDEMQPVALHKEIMENAAFAKVKKTLTKRNQYRKIWITLGEDLKKVYFDDDGNLQFNDYFLEEITQSPLEKLTTTQPSTVEELLQKLLEANKKEEKSADKIAKEFILQKFDNKTVNTNQWLKQYEDECTRFNITQDKKKIEILKFFLEKNCLDWYECVLMKLTIDSEWNEWKKKFCDTFANKGWSPIRYAMAFKYQTGSLVEFALKKEKLLLETRKTIDVGTLLDLIAVSLPNYVSDRIDRDALVETEDLYNELGKLEHLVHKNINITNIKEEKKQTEYNKKIKTPCEICKKKINKIRFHQAQDCWFKDKTEPEKKVNKNFLELEVNSEDPKNFNTHH